MSLRLVRKAFSQFSRHSVPVETAPTDGNLPVGTASDTSDESP